MPFMEQTVVRSLPVWDRCAETPFVRGLADGTLPPERFRDYMVQDAIYLRHYARVFGQMIYRSGTMEEIQICYTALEFAAREESESRLRYLSRFGLTGEEAARIPPLPENAAYIDFLLAAAERGDFREMLMAVLPCMFSYSYIFRKLAGVRPPYRDFVLDYAGEDYAESCRELYRFAGEKCADQPPEVLARLDGIFQRGSELELLFWRMGGAA